MSPEKSTPQYLFNEKKYSSVYIFWIKSTPGSIIFAGNRDSFGHKKPARNRANNPKVLGSNPGSSINNLYL